MHYTIEHFVNYGKKSTVWIIGVISQFQWFLRSRQYTHTNQRSKFHCLTHPSESCINLVTRLNNIKFDTEFQYLHLIWPHFWAGSTSLKRIIFFKTKKQKVIIDANCINWNLRQKWIHPSVHNRYSSYLLHDLWPLVGVSISCHSIGIRIVELCRRAVNLQSGEKNTTWICG